MLCTQSIRGRWRWPSSMDTMHPGSVAVDLRKNLGEGLGRKLEQDLTGRTQMRTLSLSLLEMSKATRDELVVDTKLCGTQVLRIANVGVGSICI